jgi:hypothetical protein
MKRFVTKLAFSALLIALIVPTTGSRCSDRGGYGGYSDYFDFDVGFDSFSPSSFFESYEVEETYYDDGGGYYDDGGYDYEEYSEEYYDGWKGKKADKT